MRKNQKQKILLEYVSANPTGDLHIGHARNAAVGDSLANILIAAGYDVTREYYINDAGNQITNLARSIETRFFEALGIQAMKCQLMAIMVKTLSKLVKT